MRQIIIGALLAIGASSVSCAGGTETDNPATLKDFNSSNCKTRSGDPGQQAIVLESDAEGLQCVEWTKEAGGSLSVRLLNFPEPCGDNYSGAAHMAADGSLELAVHKADCQVFRCGSCLFDFDFELAGVDSSRPLSLHLGSAICASEPTTFSDEVTLPVDQQGSGVVCRYLERGPVEQYGIERTRCGERNLPCGNCGGADQTTCAAGSTCMQIADNDSRCLQSCDGDADCAGGLTTCKDGVCQAGFSW